MMLLNLFWTTHVTGFPSSATEGAKVHVLSSCPAQGPCQEKVTDGLAEVTLQVKVTVLRNEG